MFDRLCSLNKCDIYPFYEILVSSIFDVNVSIASLQKGMMNKLGIKYIDYDSIKKYLLNKLNK